MHEQVSERTGFLFETALEDVDPIVARVTAHEEARQIDKLIMIASESAAPPAVRQALASVFTDLYAEGYPAAHTSHESEDLLGDVPYQMAYHERYSDRRYYKGTELADVVEALAQHRIRGLFAPNRYPHNPAQLGPDQIQANVQPLSGANANTAVYFALLQPGDTILGLDLAQGGHLTHGSPVNFSGKLFHFVHYGVRRDTERIDYDQVREVALRERPKMIVAGATAYPRIIDFAAFRSIADEVGAYLLVDMAHIAGLVAAGVHPSPVPLAEIVTLTTHKTLRGPRGGMILCRAEFARKVDSAVFPGMQGGPLDHVIAAKAVALHEAQQPEYRAYQAQVVRNAQALAAGLAERGLRIVSGGTDNHLVLVDLTALDITGQEAADRLEAVGIVTNKNMIPFDTRKPMQTSGLRLGTPALTTRGMGEAELAEIAELMVAAIQHPDGAHQARCRARVQRLCEAFPAPVEGLVPA